MDISRALAYITDDEDWLQKLLIGGLLTLIPLVGPIYALGYATEVLRNIIQGRESPLPDLTEGFGEKLLHGLLVWVITMIYMLPLILVASATGITIAVTGGAADSDAVGAVAAICGSCGGLIGLALLAASGLFLPYAWSSYAESGEFGAAFKLSNHFEMIKANLGPTVIVLLVVILLGIVSKSVGSAVCGIGLAFATFYSRLVTAFLYGTLYNKAKTQTQ